MTDGANGLVDVDEQLVRQLAERARADGLKLTGEGGLLQRLTKLVVESSLEGELDDHLGYGKHDPAGRDGGNSRNGKRATKLANARFTYAIDCSRLVNVRPGSGFPSPESGMVQSTFSCSR